MHLRRNGYEQFCKGSSGKQQHQQGGEMKSGLDFYGRQRFGFAISDEMCYPSTVTVATDAVAAAASAAASGSSSTQSSGGSREEEVEEAAPATAPLFLATDVATVAEENADTRALLAQGLRVVALHTAPAPPATTTTTTGGGTVGADDAESSGRRDMKWRRQRLPPPRRRRCRLVDLSTGQNLPPPLPALERVGGESSSSSSDDEGFFVDVEEPLVPLLEQALCAAAEQFVRPPPYHSASYSSLAGGYYLRCGDAMMRRCDLRAL